MKRYKITAVNTEGQTIEAFTNSPYTSMDLFLEFYDKRYTNIRTYKLNTNTGKYEELREQHAKVDY